MKKFIGEMARRLDQALTPESEVRPTNEEALTVLAQCPGFNEYKIIDTDTYETALLAYWRKAHPKDPSSDADVRLKSLTPLMHLNEANEICLGQGGMTITKNMRFPQYKS